MRKYLFSVKTVTTAFGVIGLIRTTVREPRDWRTAMLWVVWASTFATAIGTVQINARRAVLEEEEYDQSVARKSRVIRS